MLIFSNIKEVVDICFKLCSQNSEVLSPINGRIRLSLFVRARESMAQRGIYLLQTEGTIVLLALLVLAILIEVSPQKQ